LNWKNARSMMDRLAEIAEDFDLAFNA
jgi:hypothetical protein